MTQSRPSIPLMVAFGLIIACLMTGVGVPMHSLFLSYVSHGELDCFQSARYCAEISSIYLIGSVIGILLEFSVIYFLRTSWFSRPLILMAYIILADLLLCTIQFLNRDVFQIYPLIAQALDLPTDSVLTLAASILCGLVSLIVVGWLYLTVYWRVIVRRLGWTDETEYKLTPDRFVV